MAEYDLTRTSIRRSITGWIGTVVGTLYGPVPPQLTLEIMEETFASPTIGTPMAYLQQFATYQGYSNLGTTTGTVVEAVVLPTGAPTLVVGSGQGVVAKVEPGNYLLGVASAGSVYVKLIARLAYGRGT
jgi:hypothetical protein